MKTLLLLLLLASLGRAGLRADGVLPRIPPSASTNSATTAEGRVFNTPVTVEILVAYTPAARLYAGGASAMLAAINSHIALTNLCYANSDIPLVLHVAAVVETNYTEASTFNTDLSRLQATSDGYMDELHTLRNNYGADLVALIRRNSAGGVAGLAYVNTGNADASFAPYAFSVTADIWASGNLAFPHELGHNFGNWHDRQNSSNLTHPYSYGWRFYGNDNVQYITVMAYYPGTRIPYFSNPTINYQGQPTGVASGPTAADAALRHEITMTGTSAYRGAPPALAATDLIWRHTDGRMVVWFQNNAVRTGWTPMSNTVGTGWRGVAIADMNADGKQDIVWHHTDGRVIIWFMDGINRASFSQCNLIAAAGWTCVGAGDLNGDGNPDLLYTHTDGRIVVWYMNGATATSFERIMLTYGPGWSPSTMADMDGDGKTDILFKHTDGRMCVWYMNGITRTSFAISSATVNQGWNLVGAEDRNADGNADLLWFNPSNGRLCIWYMSAGLTRTSFAMLDSTVGAGWSLVED